MKFKHALIGSLFVSLIACGGDDESSSASKQDMAQKLTRVSMTMQTVSTAVLAAPSGPAPQNAGGLHLNDTSSTVHVNCQGGGTADATVTSSGTSGTQGSGEGTFSFDATYHGCKSGQATIDGGPLSLDVNANVSGGGTNQTQLEATLVYNGSVSIAGTEDAGTYSFSNLTVKYTGSFTQGGAVNFTVTVNGTFSVNGSSFTFNNESFTYSGSAGG